VFDSSSSINARYQWIDFLGQLTLVKDSRRVVWLMLNDKVLGLLIVRDLGATWVCEVEDV
jgi:hypothetical protein